MKGLPPTPERFLSLLKLFAAARYNVVLVEWEDSFPWTVDERFRSPTAYTADDVAQFAQTAAGLGIELIPLVQCLGHMENPLSVKGYEPLREVPDIESGLNPLAPGARELIQNMVDDVLTLMPGTKHFHLGGDEARTFGLAPETKAYIEKHGKGRLSLHHIEPILDALNRREIRPILWHDMMNDWDSAALRALAAKCDLMPWGYAGHPDTTPHHFNTKYIKRYSEHGFTLWGGTAYKGAEGYDADLSNNPLHTENALAWVEVGQRFGFEGVIATAWSRYSVDTIQCNPIDACLDSLLNVAVILHEGLPPKGGWDACVEALDDVGEKQRFLECRAAIADLARLRKAGWEKVQGAWQLTVLGKMDPRRISARNLKLGLHWLVGLNHTVRELEKVILETRRCFDGLVDPVWIEEYLATRVEPLRRELGLLLKENHFEESPLG
ncbi:MAG: family 20 glycosylhydrolase [Verrucomicrobia bacterium]|nr:family 20 glycosylhydrolase [Verrucomicrobiota bacterium]